MLILTGKYMKRKRPLEPKYREIYGKDRLSYGEPKGFAVVEVDVDEDD